MKQAEPMNVAVTSAVFASALLLCTGKSNSAAQVLPDGSAQNQNILAYIDRSHLEAFSSDLWNDYGIAGFTRVLIRSGFLPLRLSELTAERLERAGLLVLMAPARRFSAEEIVTVRRFVEQGGTLICLVGAEEARASAALLNEFQFNVDPSPIGPRESIREPDPLGALSIRYGRPSDPKIDVQFYAAWPTEIIPQSYKTYVTTTVDGNSWPVVSRTKVGQGEVLFISDTFFATNQNLESAGNVVTSHINFWRMLLSDNMEKQFEAPVDEPIKEQGLDEGNAKR